MKKDKHGCLEMTEMNYDKDRPKAAKPIKVQDVTFRDGHQSLFATRGRTEDMIHVAEDMDEIGFYSMEVWGGATFDVMHRFLIEDPWERITVLKKHLKKTPISMLLRGQNLVGYRNYADDVVEEFVQRACDLGIDIFRVFDALNDFRNFETAVKIIKKNKKHFQGTICYSLTEMRMGGDVYDINYYLEKADKLVEMEADSICIKDMAGLISPYDVYNLIRALKERVKVPIHLHTHFTSGMGDLALLKAIEAGVDIIDTNMAPYAYRTAHPAIEPLVISLLGTNRDTGFDIRSLVEINKKLEKVIPKYLHYLDTTKLAIIDPNVIIHQTPGGMISNLVNQLKNMDALERLDDVFEELPKVRKDLGQVPLVTPTSQIVGTQTVNNVLFDDENEEYTKVTEQVKDLCYGLYGKTTMSIDPKIRKKILKDYPKGEDPVDVRPGDIIEPELSKVRKELGDLAKSKDDVLLCALYPVTGKQFLKWKYGLEEKPKELNAKTLEDVRREKKLIEEALSGKLTKKVEIPEKPKNTKAFDVFVDGDYFKVEVANSKSRSNTATSDVNQKATTKEQIGEQNKDVLTAPIPGMVVECKKHVGEAVKAGETVVVLEAMKMLNNIHAKSDGVIREVKSKTGDSVSKGDVLLVIEPPKFKTKKKKQAIHGKHKSKVVRKNARH